MSGSRSFIFDYNDEIRVLLEPLMEEIRKNLDKYFVAFRTNPNRMTIYYKGQEAITLNLSPNNVWTIKSRKKTSSVKENYKKINEEFEEKLEEYQFLYDEEEIITSDMDCVKFLKINQKWIDDYYFGKESEKTIQGDIACHYQTLKNDLLCVDMEYIVSKEVKGDKDISGRYDLVFLKLNEMGKYEIIFAELKSNRGACVDATTGLINHIQDMSNFILEYKSDKEFQEKIVGDILFSLEMKNKLRLIDSNITSADIEFEACKYFLIFKMVHDHKMYTPMTRGEVKKFILEEIDRVKYIKSLIPEHYSKLEKILDEKVIDIDGVTRIKKYEIEEEHYEHLFEKVFSQDAYYVDDKFCLKRIL